MGARRRPRALPHDLADPLAGAAFHRVPGTLSVADMRWVAIGLPCFGVALAALIGIGIFAALASAAEIGRRYEEAGPGMPAFATHRRLRVRGDWAARALPFTFAASETICGG